MSSKLNDVKSRIKSMAPVITGRAGGLSILAPIAIVGLIGAGVYYFFKRSDVSMAGSTDTF